MNDSTMTLMVFVNIALTGFMFLVFYKILKSKNRTEGNYPMP